MKESAAFVATVIVMWVAWLASTPIASAAEKCGSTGRSDLSTEFRKQIWTSRPAGFVATGLVGVPFASASDGSYARDLVVTNGNDLAPQPLTIFYNNKNRAAAFQMRVRSPEWTAESNAMHGHAAAGDIDGDGLIDLAVSIIRDHPDVWDAATNELKFRPGGVALYFGAWGLRDGSPCRPGDPGCVPTLERQPRQTLLNSFGATSISLGDANGDGWLDLAVAPTYSSKRPLARFPLPGEALPTLEFARAPWRLYETDNGPLDLSRPPRVSEQEFYGGDAELADVNQDGRLDLVLAEQSGIHVFYGRREANGSSVPLRPDWSSEGSYCKDAGSCASVFATSLDTGFLSLGPDSNGLAIAVGTACFDTTRPCQGSYLLYQPKLSKSPRWRSSWTGWAGEVRLRDIDSDCLTDLIGAPWWIDATQPGFATAKPQLDRPRVYRGDGSSLESEPKWQPPEDPWVAQGIELADFTCEDITRVTTRPLAIPRKPYVFTIRDPDLELIHRVSLVDPDGTSRLLSPPAVTWAIGEPWVMLSGTTELRSGSKLVIEYTRSYRPDIAIGDWGQTRGVSVYERISNSPTDKDCTK